MAITLYHLTPAKNLQSIRDNGIQPSKDGYVYLSLNKFDTIFFAPWGGEILFCGGKSKAPPLVILGVKIQGDELLKTVVKHFKIDDLDGNSHIAAEILYPGVVSVNEDLAISSITADEIIRRYRNSEYQ